MGKSLGNFMTLKDAFSRWHPQIIRFFILQSHYRSTLDFSGEAVEGASRGLEKLNAMRAALSDKMGKAAPGGEPSGIDVQSFKQEFLDAMDDDFNTPRALAVLFDLTREVNSLLSHTRPVSRGSLEEIDALYAELGEGVLGISTASPLGAVVGEPHLEGGLVELLLDVRRELRVQKQWVLSDRIRHGLSALGVTIEDTKEGSAWKKTS
jgi:cysteinyl-tRNA synthetase